MTTDWWCGDYTYQQAAGTNTVGLGNDLTLFTADTTQTAKTLIV